MSIKTIGFLYPGAMGASLAWRLHQRQPHLTLLTNLSSRSQATTKRSEAAGLQDVSLADVATRSDIIISILPPSAAITLAKEILAVLPRDKKPVYVDANAISPGTVSEIAKLLKERNLPFIDGSVIGGPAKEGYDPKIYLSTAKEYDGILEQVGEVLSGGAQGKGLKIEVMTGAGEGAASALKMAYGGIAKGTTGLAAIMVLSAHAHSPETADALLKELSQSRPGALEGFSKGFPEVIHKAYRFVGEMEENAAFIRTSLAKLQGASTQDAAAPSETYQGLAKVYQRIADDLYEHEAATGKGATVTNGARNLEGTRAGEIDVLREWAKKGQAVMEGIKKS